MQGGLERAQPELCASSGGSEAREPCMAPPVRKMVSGKVFWKYRLSKLQVSGRFSSRIPSKCESGCPDQCWQRVGRP